MFGQRLKEERARLGVTQPQLAELVGSAKRTIVDWEQEKSSPTAKQLMIMQSIGGIDVTYLLTGVRSEAPDLTTEEALIIEKYRHSSPEIRNKLLLLLLGHDDVPAAPYKTQGIHNSPNSRISNSFNQN